MTIYKEGRVPSANGKPITAWFLLRRHTFVAYKIHFTGLLRDNETISLAVQGKPLFTGINTLSMSEDCIVINTFPKCKSAHRQIVKSVKIIVCVLCFGSELEMKIDTNWNWVGFFIYFFPHLKAPHTSTGTY